MPTNSTSVNSSPVTGTVTAVTSGTYYVHVRAVGSTTKENGNQIVTVNDTANNYTLTAAQGSYALTGQPTTLKKAVIVQAVQGSYALSGQAINLTFGYSMPADQGSYSLNGQETLLPASWISDTILAGAGSTSSNAVLESGAAVTLNGNLTILPDADRKVAGATALTVVGMLSPSGEIELPPGEVNLSGAGTFSGAGEIFKFVSASVSATGSIDPLPDLEAASTITAISTVAAFVFRQAVGNILLAGKGTLLVPKNGITASSTLPSVGSQLAAGERTLFGHFSSSGIGAMASLPSLSTIQYVSISGQGTMSSDTIKYKQIFFNQWGAS